MNQGNFFINHYSEDAQMGQLAKEAVELAHAINNYRDGKGTLEQVKDEMGDCLNIIEQFSQHWNDGSVYNVVRRKQQRQLDRIKETDDNTKQLQK